MNSRQILRWIFSYWTVAVFLGALSSSPARAETLPPAVSEMIRQLGELRDIAWGLLTEARKLHTNDQALIKLNKCYIEASAAANSLIEQVQLETVARTRLDPKRYEPTLKRTKDKCQAFVEEWEKLCPPPPKTRGEKNSSDSESSANDTATLIYENAQKTVVLADGLMSFFTRHRRAFRDLDAQQRAEVRKLLEAHKWSPLEKVHSKHESPSAQEAVPAEGQKPKKASPSP